MAVVAGVLALYGSMVAEKHFATSPLRQARGSAGLPAPPTTKFGQLWVRAETTLCGDRFDHVMLAMTQRSKIANYSLQLIAYVLPFFLGLAAALTGGWAMKVVQQSEGRYAGNTLAVFAMLIGGAASVVAGCMILSLYIWPYIPNLYTT
ncbi:MAG: hypothetical protein RMJ56_06170 [Gemmataceae bacterium]|nr:hypothetical protein [Gemmata sp.]MDW8197175.1 hypothetical protein [Gemmataceae bacterium]